MCCDDVMLAMGIKTEDIMATVVMVTDADAQLQDQDAAAKAGLFTLCITSVSLLANEDNFCHVQCT